VYVLASDCLNGQFRLFKFQNSLHISKRKGREEQLDSLFFFSNLKMEHFIFSFIFLKVLQYQVYLF
jgi:hypothetical protein